MWDLFEVCIIYLHIILAHTCMNNIQIHTMLSQLKLWFLGQSTRGWFWVGRSNGMDTSLWKDDANICIHYDISHSIMRSSGEQRIIIIHDCAGNNQITKVKSPWEFFSIFQPILTYFQYSSLLFLTDFNTA